MKGFLLLGAALSGVVLTGCVAGNGYAAVRFGAPPSPRYGVMGYAPGPGFVWTEGYWDWRGGRWVWGDGRWLRPPRARAVWGPRYWRGEPHPRRVHRGFWR